MGRGKGLIVVLALALGVPLLLSSTATADPSPAAAIAELNGWRAQLGEAPVSTADVAAWSTACAHHNNYEQDNDQLTHFESSGTTGYTPDGAVAGPDSVLAEEVDSPTAPPDASMLPGPVWDPAVFHRAALLQPRLANIGFNATTFQSGNRFTSWQCLWDQNAPSDSPSLTPPFAIDNSRTTPGLTLYPSPANGSYDVPTTFPGGESPNPATETGVPPGATLGWLMNVEINGPWPDAGGGGIVFANGVSATLGPDGSTAQVPIAVSECGNLGCFGGGQGQTTLGQYMGGGFGIFPTQPLAANTIYRVTATGTVTDNSGPGPQLNYPFTIHWCFSTGSTYTPSSDCSASSASDAIEPVHPSFTLTVAVNGHGSVSGGGVSCPGTCTHALLDGTAVTLHETPTPGSRFAGWSGGCSGTRPSCTVTPSASPAVSASLAVSASFVVAAKLSRGNMLLGTHPRLTFLAAGGNLPLRTIVVSPPRGISFASRRRSLAHGVVVKVSDRRVGISVAGGRSLRVTLTQPAKAISVSISSPALVLSKRFRRHFAGALRFVVELTGRGGGATSIPLAFTYH